MKKVTFLVVFLILATAIAASLTWNRVRSLRFALEYVVLAKYTSMPDNDKDVEEWLHTQPGVTHALVVRNPRGLEIDFVMVQNIQGTDPPTPDLQAALDGFGYRGQVRFNWESRGLYVK